MSSLSLVVLAAGMGSRYGGLKQLDPVGPGGEIQTGPAGGRGEALGDAAREPRRRREGQGDRGDVLGVHGAGGPGDERGN